MNHSYAVLNQISVSENALDFTIYHNIRDAKVNLVLKERYPYEEFYANSLLADYLIDGVELLPNSIIFSIPRFDGERDRICNKFKVDIYSKENLLEVKGICYVTEMGEISKY